MDSLTQIRKYGCMDDDDAWFNILIMKKKKKFAFTDAMRVLFSENWCRYYSQQW